MVTDDSTSGMIRLPNPIWLVQFRLLRGRRIMLIAALWSAGLVVVPLAIHRLEPSWTAAEAFKALAVLQILTVLSGCSAVFRAIGRDRATRMLESHRLSPINASTVVVGYLFGPTMQTLLLFLVTVVYGTALALVSDLSAAGWLAGNLVLLTTALMAWSLVICSGTGSEKPINPTGIFVGAGFVGAMLGAALPGVGLVTGAFSVVGGFWAMTGRFEWAANPTAVVAGGNLQPPAMAVLMVANLLMTLVWSSASARRYRRPDRPAFDARNGTVLLILWLAGAGLGIALFDRLSPGTIETSRQFQFIATLLLSLLLAAVPVSGACIDRARLLKGGQATAWAERVSSRWVIMACVGAVCLAMGLSGAYWEDGENRVAVAFARATAGPWACTVLAAVAGMTALDGFFRVMYLARRRILGPSAAFVFAIWLAPPAVDYLLGLWRSSRLADPFGSLDFSLLFGCSPPATIVAVWTDLNVPVWPGLIVQVVLAAVMTRLAIKAERAEIRRRRADGLELPGLRR